MARNARIDLREWPDPRAPRSRRPRMQVVRRSEISDEQRQLRRLWLQRMALITGLVLVTAVPAAWLIKRYAQSFEVQAVTIEGEFHNEQAHEIELALLPYVKGDFFTADLVNARAALLELSWIRDVSLKRRWPNRIIVKIEEQVPVAVWNKTLFLNDAAGIFKHRYVDPTLSLPSLSGPEGSEAEMLAQFMLWNGWLKQAGLDLAGIRLDTRRSWLLITVNGVEINLGKEKVEARLQRFLRTYPRYLKSRMTDVRAVDLRYSNGFAVSWKDPAVNDTGAKRNRDV
ncbi:MAG TPA: cell division protein FtsQ/DivIB [Gammaproteobacteria bacterium]|nr:cell division protein FtsQ/DivIB [Gammaproteobacteria bacterium]